MVVAVSSKNEHYAINSKLFTNYRYFSLLLPYVRVSEREREINFKKRLHVYILEKKQTNFSVAQ